MKYETFKEDYELNTDRNHGYSYVRAGNGR